jgi:hypothetical protein
MVSQLRHNLCKSNMSMSRLFYNDLQSVRYFNIYQMVSTSLKSCGLLDLTTIASF